MMLACPRFKETRGTRSVLSMPLPCTRTIACLIRRVRCGRDCVREGGMGLYRVECCVHFEFSLDQALRAEWNGLYQSAHDLLGLLCW